MSTTHDRDPGDTMATERPIAVRTLDGRPMRLGLTTPALTMLPDNHAGWEREVRIEDIAAIARTADRLGYSHLSCSEHVIIPTDVAAVRGSRYWDPLAIFGYLAAVTTRIRFATNVLVLGYHHPLEIAKRYGTLDQVTGGRVILGLGVGSLREEFELLQVPFDDRGDRADDALRALRVSLSTNQPSYHGTYYSYDDVILDPCARQDRVPLWIGGRTARSLRRAVELGDGWVPFGLGTDDMARLIARARQGEAWAARAEVLDLVLQNNRPADPLADAAGARHIVERLAGAGATAIQLRLIHHSAAHYAEQLEAMMDALA